MTNIDAGSQRIRRLPDKPIVGETTPTPEGFTRLIGMMPSAIWHGYTGRRTAGSAAHTALRCTMCRVGALSCGGITAPGASSVPTIAAKGGERYDPPRLGDGSGNTALFFSTFWPRSSNIGEKRTV